MVHRSGQLVTRFGPDISHTPVGSVIRDSGERASIPPFGAEHTELRETISRWVRAEIVPHLDEWERAREFPRAL